MFSNRWVHCGLLELDAKTETNCCDMDHTEPQREGWYSAHLDLLYTNNHLLWRLALKPSHYVYFYIECNTRIPCKDQWKNKSKVLDIVSCQLYIIYSFQETADKLVFAYFYRHCISLATWWNQDLLKWTWREFYVKFIICLWKRHDV